ncbi:MAG TPA: error-prone DNA polymerase [Gemmatimonadaceae bacterium]|nr:error-prone DNA polymerase [Gemmatimonadaceae bacterium]
MKYIELRAHTAFSFGDGANTPEQLIARASALGYDTIGITDTADLGGIVRAVCAGQQHGVRVIAGAELRVDGFPLAFLARTEAGYRNLASLVTAARVGTWRTWDKNAAAKERGQPNVTWAQVCEHNEGLQLLTGPASGQLAQSLTSGHRAHGSRLLAEWHEVFGSRLAVEVQMHHVGGNEAALAAAQIALAQWCAVPWVVAHDPRYIDDSSRVIHDMLTALRYSQTVEDAERAGVLHPNGEWKLLSPDDMSVRWRRAEQGIEESARIASECRFDLAWMRPPLPDYRVPDGGSEDEFLRARVYDGARTRWGATLTDPQRNQIEHELTIIRKLGFAGFFLVMWDATQFAKRNNILCQGRGSAANSTVAYCLGITPVDPVKHGLLFERFLSEVRVDGKAEAPDIDVDFEHDRREEVLDYLYNSYHRPHAAIAATVQTYRAPNAVLDSMRAFGYPADLATSISKRLHRYDPRDAAVHMQAKYAKEAGLDPTTSRVKGLLRAIAGFEGLPRLRATHVGGFVLSRKPLGGWLPIEQTTMGRTIVQFDKDDLDAIGVPKFDFLGLGGLAMVKRAFQAIEVRTGKKLEMYSLPQDDAPTYELISRGDTIGTFQIESRAQIASIVHTKPDRLYDIVVQVALIRPGPIQAKFVRPYTRRRRGEERVTYAHPKLEPILKRTQGIPIFQEQAMAIAMALAGYTGSEADELRRTMGNIRKEPRLLAALERLRTRMAATGIGEELAATICEDLKSFANYGFPESHAWSFALIAYATAYLKVHYPAEFYLGLLNAWPMGFYSPATLIHEAKRGGVDVRMPCLARGDWECSIEDEKTSGREDGIPALRVGWRFVRGMGGKTLDRLRAARDQAPFTSIADVVSRAKLTRAEVTCLSLANAFSAWEPDRYKASWEALRACGDTLPLAPARPLVFSSSRLLTRDETIALDYLATGSSIHGHPMMALRDRLRAKGVLDTRDLTRLPDGRTVAIAGLVVVRQRPSTANGTIFLLLEDEHGFVNVIVPKKLVEPNEKVVKHAQFMLVRGKLERRDAEISVLGRQFTKLHSEPLAHASRDFH